MNKSFSFFAPAYIEKSTSTTPSLTNPVKVGGIITTTDKDVDGERISKSSDFSYFENGFGKIKFEHQDYKEPYSFIGSPLKIIRKGRETHFIGELYPFDPNAEKQKTPQRELAKAAYGLLLEIEEHNKRHPNNLQKAGWSIEGDYLEKDKKTGLVKARIVNVVLTTKPRNMQTFAQLVKSLEVGYGMTPGTQTGFGATAVSSLQGDKNLAINQLKKGANKMPKSKKEVYENLIGEGKTHEEALKGANEFETQKENTISENFVKAEKSLGSAKEKLTKSIETANSILDIDTDVNVDEHKHNLSKSLKTEVGEDFDAGAFLIEQAKVLAKSLEVLDATNKKIDMLAKSIITNTEAEVERLNNAEFVQNIVADSRSEVLELKKSLAIFSKKLAKSTGLTTFTEAAIAGAKVEEGAKPAQKPLTKSVILDTLDKLAEEGKVEKSAVTRFESNMMMFEPEFILEKNELDLVKSKVAELSK